MHLRSVFEAPQRTFKVWVRTLSDISTCLSASVPTSSVKVRAGTVVEPSSWILAPIQQVMPSSRLVAERRKRPSSVATNTLASTGRVLRVDTARETMLRPWARFSCRTDTFIVGTLRDLVAVNRVYNVAWFLPSIPGLSQEWIA